MSMAAAATSTGGTSSVKPFSSPFQSQHNSPHSSPAVIDLNNFNISTSRNNKENIQHNHQVQQVTSTQQLPQPPPPPPTSSSSHSSQQTQNQNKELPIFKPDLFFNDTGLFTVYCFIKNFIG